MIDNLIIARANSYGLSRDSELLISALSSIDQTVSVKTPKSRGLINRLRHRRQAGRIIHVERAFKAWLSAGHDNVLIPNQERFPLRLVPELKKMDRVLTKTHHALEIFGRYHERVSYLGFTSHDRLDPAVGKDWRSFLHIAGGSTLKGTDELLNLWLRHPQWPQLVIVQKSVNAPRSVPPNVKLMSGYLPDLELRRLQNSCGIHLCPSRAEGWGHHIVEALSCGAIAVVTDAPPMNEHVDRSCGVLVPAARSAPRHLGTQYFVDVEALEAAIFRILSLPDRDKAVMGQAARERFLEINTSFHGRVRALLRTAELPAAEQAVAAYSLL